MPIRYFYNRPQFIFICLKWVEKKIFYRSILILFSILLIQSVLIIEKYKLSTINEFIVFNNGRKSMIGDKRGHNLTIFINDLSSIKDYSLKPYLVGSGITNYEKNIEDVKLFRFKNEIILIVDSLGLYKFGFIKPTIIVLQKSPKINLNRMLKVLKPKLVIADGSNYKSYIKTWDQSCYKNKTPFYTTMQKGAYILR